MNAWTKSEDEGMIWYDEGDDEEYWESLLLEEEPDYDDQ